MLGAAYKANIVECVYFEYHHIASMISFRLPHCNEEMLSCCISDGGGGAHGKLFLFFVDEHHEANCIK